MMSSDRLNAVFAALSDPTRRAMLERLAQGSATVMELSAPFQMSQPAISKHLKVLENAGLVSRGRDAQRRPCRLERAPLAAATQWLELYRHVEINDTDTVDTLIDGFKAMLGRSTEPRR